MRNWRRAWPGALLLFLLVLLGGCTRLDRVEAERTLQYLEHHRRADPGGLKRWLTHRDPAIRLRAVETLGRIQEPAQKELLISRLSDPDPRVQDAAIFALGQLFSPAVEALLYEGLQQTTDPRRKFRFIEALGKCGTETAADGLMPYLSDADPRVRKAAAISLGQLAERKHFPRSISPALAEMLLCPEEALSWAGAYALFRLSALRTFNDLAGGLDTPHPLTRHFVLKGLERLFALLNSPDFAPYQSQPAYRPLVQKFQSRPFRDKIALCLSDSVWFVQVAALQALETLRDPRYQRQIAGLLKHPHPSVRLTALRTLRKFPGEATEKTVHQVYEQASDWRTRGEALVTLACISPKTALEWVKKDWLTRDWPQSYYAVLALDSLRSPLGRAGELEREATFLLIQLAEVSYLPQANLAIEALIERPNPPALDYFINKLTTGDAPIITVIASYLSLVEDPRVATAVQPLVRAYQTLTPPRDLEAMQAILTALDSIRNADAVPFLQTQLTSPYRQIRQSTRHALRRIAGDTRLAIPRVDNLAPTRTDFPPLSPDSSYRAHFATDAGNFVVELFPEAAPLTVANFVFLVRAGFYNGIGFHRIVPGFVAQGGDPRGDGWGGPGYAILCEYNPHPYERGVVGMALSGKDTGGSQFFITHTPQPHLNGKYTVFGRVQEGMDAVDRLQKFDRIKTATIVTALRNPRYAADR